MGVFTALPVVIFILAAVTQFTLCVFSLRAERLKLAGVMVILFRVLGPKTSARRSTKTNLQ
ncbi:hypothetical protein BKA65DRAFT_545017 [Rhexocercosporidium sp. MPI-PUGE-AT-0058]|nr:hypothetical protein BKA65DRAFT_545017 [Rhexocercosporidium sp. MPI-PUGE-AT-0058]